MPGLIEGFVSPRIRAEPREACRSTTYSELVITVRFQDQPSGAASVSARRSARVSRANLTGTSLTGATFKLSCTGWPLRISGTAKRIASQAHGLR